MSIWGKISGAAAGFLGGGPIGALLGAIAGHVLVDGGEFGPVPDGFEGDQAGVAFTIAVIALAAKMAKADGAVSPDEIAVFERIFQVPPGEEANVRRLFNQAQRDTAGYETYAAQITRMFIDRPAVLEDVLDGLFEIAKADGVYHPAEAAFLERVADIFGFAPNEFRRIRASHIGTDVSDPYAILGVAYTASEIEIKHSYHRLVKENHPDSLIARGVPEEFIKLANDKLAAINTAYDKVRRERAFY